MQKIVLGILITIWIGLTLFVRTVGLEKSPISLGYDEASLGYNAYSLYLTGKDEYGNPYPLSLRSFNDFKPALYAYFVIPFIHFFDLNQTSVRLPSTIMGTISLVFLLMIFKKLSGKSILVSLLTVAVISFFPWRIHFSRVALESNISMAFFTGLVWCLINYKQNLFYKVGLFIFSALSIYSYHSSRIAVPILFILAFIDPLAFNFKGVIKKIKPLLLMSILYIPLILGSQSKLLLTRLNQTNVFSHFYPFAPRELINTSNIWLSPLANPLYYLGGILSGHLFAYFSPKNLSLLIYPGVVKSAQVISGTGMLGFFGGLLFIIGLIYIFKDLFINKERRIILYWILAGIVPAAIAWEWFYPLRSLNIYPALDIIAGFGLLAIFGFILRIKNRIITYAGAFIVITVILTTSFYNVLNEYNYGARDTSGEFQPGGFKEGAPLLLSLKDNYKTVYIDSGHAQNYVLLWFYMKYPPENIQKIAYRRNVPGVEGPPTIDFDNFVYKKFDWPSDKKGESFVYWTSSEVKDNEIKETPGAKLYRIQDPLGNWPVSIITKE